MFLPADNVIIYEPNEKKVNAGVFIVILLVTYSWYYFAILLFIQVYAELT